MTELAARFLQAFIPLFVALDPVGMAAIFIGLSAGVPAVRKRRIARQAVATGGVVALAFLFLGRGIFRAVGITVGDFQIAGGLILFILAARDLLQPFAAPPPDVPEDFGVVPLGMPLIAGPAAITTLLLLAQTVGLGVTLAALAVNLALLTLSFSQADRLVRVIGPAGLRAISKIVSLLLAAIAISLIRRGWGA